MLKKVILSVLISISLSFAQSIVEETLETDVYENDEKEFSEFKTKFEKQYNPQEAEQRFQIFRNNRRLMARHNKRFDLGEVTWEMDIGPFADLTEEDFMNKFKTSFPTYKCTKGNVDITDFCQNISYDNTKEDLDLSYTVGIAKDQKDCNAGWAFAATAAIESMFYIKGKKYEILSEQNLIDCAYGNLYGAFGCSGANLQGPMMYLTMKGITLENKYPFQGNTCDCKSVRDDLYRIDSFWNIESTEESLKRALNKGPVILEIEVTPTIMHYKRGVIKDSHCLGTLNHAVAVMGYGQEYFLPYWILRNSWGPHWGENGFYKLARDRRYECAISEEAFSISDVSPIYCNANHC